MADLRILSLGAGVQSSTLALMIEKGEIPMVDAAIFADVKGEPLAVYKHLNWLEKQVSYPIYRVSWRNLKKDIFDASEGNYKGFTAPFYTKNEVTGKKGMLRRQCTADYKIKPVVKKIRELLGYKKGERVKKGTNVELLMGISKDEIFRMKTNRLKYLKNCYPLVDLDMRRNHCLEWIEKNNYPKPPRSACTFCPFHSKIEWLEIKKNKNEWNEVVAMDRAIRNQEKFKKNKNGSDFFEDKLYLHRNCEPIENVNFEEEDNQLDLFNMECEGYCGN